MVTTNLTALLSSLITANHILHQNSVLDGLGHVFVRHPTNNATFLMTGSPPALITSPSDLRELYISDAGQNQRSERFIHQERLGEALANNFSTPANNVTKDNSSPDYTVVMQRGHGFVTVSSESIEQAVYRAIYTHYDAKVQAMAFNVQSASGVIGKGLTYLSEREANDCVPMNDDGLEKDYLVWEKQVEVDPLYKHDLL